MKIKRILSIILLLIFLLSTFGCYNFGSYNAVENDLKNFEDDGEFVYGKITDRYDKNYGKYALCGQVALELPETIYIPPFYKDKDVVQLGYSFGARNLDYGVVPLFKDVNKLYLSYNCSFFFENLGYNYIKNLEEPFVSYRVFGPRNLFVPYVADELTPDEIKSFEQLKQKYGNIDAFYVSRKLFDEITKKGFYFAEFEVAQSQIKYIDYYNGMFKIILANTTYYFNYEGSPNDDIFFINDFERGGKIENTPYEPLREGYKFAGWYKEPECINAWDFDNDLTPELEYDEQGELIFKETSLYAKWI